ncbi:hypothetical protein POM88_040049 [Heracleum sosnowskyi]|uniref:Uncharacterized protein n=1 Tax=Heracleum sosnowskyi TaxID=360622 RepID=A0AAD8M9X6_9APIA|nr:hypothetical protein POM88_040049 [Heracleum sosnowskyi]
MDSGDQWTGAMDGSCCEGKRKKCTAGMYRPSASLEPMPLAMMPPSENSASGAEHMLEVHDPETEIEYHMNMEIEENTARQAQRQMRKFTSTFTELCNGFVTSNKKVEELGKHVTNLEGQIQIWKDKEAKWDEKKKEIERERNEAREEARRAVNEKRSLEQKLEKAAKQYKTGLGSFVAYLANGEGKSMGDYVDELAKETPGNSRSPADGAEHEANLMGP